MNQNAGKDSMQKNMKVKAKLHLKQDCIVWLVHDSFNSFNRMIYE